MRRISLFLLAIPLLAQAPDKNLRFDVVSLKPSNGSRQDSGIRPAPGGQRYEAWNCPIKTMIQVAYRVKPEQVTGGPGWLDTDRFDMEAKAEKPSTTDELHVMLMNMLADRLRLKYHLEKKEMAMYALTAGSEPKLTPHPSANSGEPWIDIAQQKFLHVKLTATSVPMDYVAYRLSLLMDRPVVNLTDLKGEFDFTLEYTRELPPGISEGARLNGEVIDTSGPTVFEAVKKLGLALKPAKGAVDVIVVDHVEKPAAN